MHLFRILLVLPLAVLPAFVHAEEDSTFTHPRYYGLVAGPPHELEIFSTAAVTLNKALIDAYFRGISPKMPPKLDPWIGTPWWIFWTFCTTMWLHDGGHWARARQVGGDFVIRKFGFPFPVAEMHLPDKPAPTDETLTSIGGHEINFLMRRQIHTDYYDQQYVYADELVNAFIQDVFYGFYTFVIAYADPKNPDVWTDTRGDPVEYTLSVYKKYTGRPPIREDGSVDPELIRQYRETSFICLPWTMLNPMFYRSLKAFAADMKNRHGLMKTPWMAGNDRIAWSWGTHFHPSPLGYELYLTNYFRVYEKLSILTLKVGRPYTNIGIGIHIPRMFEKKRFRVGVSGDAWFQDIYGNGGSVEVDARCRVHKRWELMLKSGWKSKGYLIGRRVDESALILGGGAFFF